RARECAPSSPRRSPARASSRAPCARPDSRRRLRTRRASSSRACRTSAKGTWCAGASRSPFRETVEDAIHFLDREVFVVALVDLHHRSGAARGQTLGRSQRHLAVRARLPRATAEALLAMFENAIRAAERTGERAAHPDLVLADGLLVEERVESNDAFDVRGAQIELACDVLDDLIGHPVAVLLLTEVQNGNARCHPVRIAGHDLFE